MSDPLTVRASSLPGYRQCPRRGAANLLWGELAEPYGLRRTKPGVGAIVGTSVHAGTASLMSEFAHTGQLLAPGALTTAQDIAIESLRRDMAGEWVNDDVTPDQDCAEFQSVRMVETYRDHMDPVSIPILIERGLRMKVGPDLIVSGHLDRVDSLASVTAQPRDLKTGRRRPQAWSQYGAYFLLLRSNSYAMQELQGLSFSGVFIEDFLPRARRNKDQPPPVAHRYDQGLIEREALETARQIERDVARFRETGEPEAFATNPSSFLCSRKFCPAWRTEWCGAGWLKEEKE